jgi:hypothetical protein
VKPGALGKASCGGPDTAHRYDPGERETGTIPHPDAQQFASIRNNVEIH